MTTNLKTLGILLFPEFETLDVFGPIEMFGLLQERIKIVLISQQGGLVQSAQGQFIHTEFNWNNTPYLDLFLIPGGIGTRKEINNSALLSWIKDTVAKTELTLSVCTGSALLAKAGVLNSLKATTNKIAFEWVVEQGPQVNWIKNARWVDAGPVITSSGISAGIDMSLYVIARLFGEPVRDEVAKRAEYIANTDSDKDPFALS